MTLLDFTHPQRVPALKLANDYRSPLYYLRLDELPTWHPYYYPDWILFRYPEWLEGGSAWVHAFIISSLIAARHASDSEEYRPVVGSDDPGYDEALAQALRTFGLRPLVAEVVQR